MREQSLNKPRKWDIDAALTELFAAPPPDRDFIATSEARVKQQALELQARKATKSPRSAWHQSLKRSGMERCVLVRKARGWAAGLLAVLLAIAATVAIVGPTQVWANLQQFLGYVPGFGFINRSEARLLARPTAQTQDGVILVIDGVVAESDQTGLLYHLEGVPPNDVWLTGPDEADQVTAWLVTDKGERYPIRGVSISGREGYLSFPPLSEGVYRITLELPRLPSARPGALPENWRIALLLEPAATAEGLPAIVYTDAVSTVDGVRLSVPVVTTTDDITAINLAGEALYPNYGISNLGGPGVGGPGDCDFYLTDSHGRRYERTYGIVAPTLLPQELAPGELQAQIVDTLIFQPLAADAERVTLYVPAVEVEIPTEVSFEVDVGNRPQVGDILLLDISLKVSDFDIHIEQGEIQQDQEGRILLALITAPVLAQDNRVLSSVALEHIPGSRLIEIGSDWQTRRLSISFELRNPDGSLRIGIQRVTINQTRMTLLGPFEITWQMPSQDSTVLH